jgi:hypothetical protein
MLIRFKKLAMKRREKRKGVGFDEKTLTFVLG